MSRNLTYQESVIARVALAAGCLVALAACSRGSDVTLRDIEVVSAATQAGAAPSMAIRADGRRVTSWVSAPDRGSDGRLYVSIDGKPPSELRDSLGAIQAHAEAPPLITFGGGDTVYVLYVVGKDVGKRFPASALRFSRSVDGGATWATPVSITDEPDPFGSHHFHALAVSPDGTVYASWLDGRDGMSATYMASSVDGGQTWSQNRRISIGETCPCCHTALAAGPNGVVYVAWRAVLDGSIRDIVIARSADRGMTWSTPHPVFQDGWVFRACPHAGPALQVDAEGRLHVLWWTGKPERGGVFYAVSNDDGATFSTPLAIDAQKVPMPTDVQLGLGANGLVMAVWDDATSPKGAVVNLRMSQDGGKAFGNVLPLSDPAHDARNPVLRTANGIAYVAWSQKDHAEMSHSAGEHKAGESMEGGAMHKMPMPVVGASQVMMRAIVLEGAK